MAWMATQHNLGPHQQMWGNFVKLTIASTAAVAVALILMALFLL